MPSSQNKIQTTERKKKNKSLNLTSDLLQFNNILILILCMSLLCLFSVFVQYNSNNNIIIHKVSERERDMLWKKW